jgi:large subunit ribosomal protein L21
MALFAVIETGGKQYRVAEGDVIEVERLPGADGDTVEFGRVLMVQELNETVIGKPTVPNAKVSARIMGQFRAAKIHGFKFKPKNNYKRSWGHRQEKTRLRVSGIEN